MNNSQNILLIGYRNPVTLHIGFTMARQRRQSDLPFKYCPVCQRPFTWRKKWANCWDEVKYCSDRCRRRRSNRGNEPWNWSM